MQEKPASLEQHKILYVKKEKEKKKLKNSKEKKKKKRKNINNQKI